MRRRFFPGLAFVTALSADISQLARVMIEDYSFSYFPDILTALGPAIYILLFLFLGRERSISSVLVTGLAAEAACIVSVVFIDPIGSFTGYLAMAAAAAFIIYAAAGAALKPVEVSTLLTVMDVSIGILILMGFMTSLRGVPVMNCIIPLIAGVVSLFGLIVARLDRSLDAKDIISFAVLFAVIAAAGSFLVTFAAEPAGTALVKLAEAIKRGVLFIGTMISRLILFLFSFLTVPEAEAPGSLEPGSGAGPDEIVIEEMIVPEWIKIVPVIAAVIVLVIVIVLVRKIRIKSTGQMTAGGAGGGRTPFLKALRLAAQKFRTWLLCRAFLKKNKGTVLGMYYTIEEMCRRTKAEKKPSETPGEFIRRIALLAEDGEEREFLNALPEKVEMALYSGKGQDRSAPDEGAAGNKSALMSMNSYIFRKTCYYTKDIIKGAGKHKNH